MSNNKKILVTLSDNNRIDQAKQLFSSVYHNAGWKGDYMLLAHEVDDEKLGWFIEKGIWVKKCNPIANDPVGMMNHHPAILDKFYLFSTDFKKWDKVIFLDSDIIVRGSINKLTKIKGFAAVKAKMRFGELFAENDTHYKDIKNNYNLNKKTFNSGLMAFSTEVINDDTLNNLLQLYHKHEGTANYNEEAILNLYFYKRWKSLPLVYNYFVSYNLHKNIKSLHNRAIVYHFVWIYWLENTRPWNKENRYYDEWKSNLDKAVKIDLNTIPDTNEWSNLRILFNTHLIKLCECFSSYSDTIKHGVDKLLGKTGNLIKKSNQKLYYKLKRTSLPSHNNLIVTLANEKYIDQAKQFFSSVYHNAGWKGDYMLLAHEIPEEKLIWFRHKGILVYKCTPLFSNSIGLNYNPVILDKLYLFSTYFKQWDKVIFIDADTIVKASLNGLTKLNKFAAADSSIKLGKQFSDDGKLFHEIKNNYNLKRRSFNTGLFVIPTGILNKTMFDDLLSLYKKYQPIAECNEEAILNLYFYKNWKSLPAVYNYFVSVHMIAGKKYERIKAIVYHFIKITGHDEYRPWHPENSFYSEWKRNLKKADGIDLNNIPLIREESKILIFYHSKLLKLKLLIKKYLKNIDVIAGNAGVRIKKRNEKLYYRLKKLKDE